MEKRGRNKVFSTREPVFGEFAAEVVGRGNSFYLRLDPRWVKFWDLEAHDWVQVRATMVRRLVEEGEIDARWLTHINTQHEKERATNPSAP